MLVKCHSDISVFILNCSLTSTFCLRRECRGLKPAVLLILALCDWGAVFFGSFARLVVEKDVWVVTSCICEQPEVLLQTGVFVLNLAVLILNTDLSDAAPVTKRNSYLHLVLFNALSVILSKAGTYVIADAFDAVGGAQEASHVLGTTFLVSIYRTTFLLLDCLYYALSNPKDGSKHNAFIDGISRGEKAIIINMQQGKNMITISKKQANPVIFL